MLFPIIIASIVGVVFLLSFSVIQARSAGEVKTRHTKNALERVITEATESNVFGDLSSASILRDGDNISAIFPRISRLPGGRNFASLILKAGLKDNMSTIVIRALIVFLIVVYLGTKISFLAGARGLVAAVIASGLLTLRFLKKKVRKRNDAFLDKFPDVLDMIVRSVRSGFPLNTAIKLISESMEDPVKEEFQIVADEIAMGRTVDQALARLAERIDEPDIHFFVVVLNVQQETGGNLAEVINNLAQVIRKRKQLRLKIRAMTSEGRTTGMILAALPICLFGVLYKVSPRHLEPLLYTKTGNYILALAVGLIVLALWIVNKMVDIDV